MIEKFFRLCTGLGPAAHANPFLNGAIDQILFGSRIENLIQRVVGSVLVDFLQPKITLQPAPANRPLADPVRRKALCKLRVVKITIFAQALDYQFNYFASSTMSRRQALAQLCD